MRWTVLGSGTLDFLPGRGPSCHLLEAGGAPILVDSGPGCLERLARLAVDPLRLGAVVHSHLHLDHLADLFPLLFHRLATAKYGGEVALPLALWGAPGHAERITALCDLLQPGLLGTSVALREQREGEEVELGPGLRMRSYPADHSRSPRILRFDGALGSIAYSGDTGPCESLVEAARGVDWLIVECSSPDARPRGLHLRPADVAAVLAEAKPRATALVHLSPDWPDPEEAAEAVRRHGGAAVLACTDGVRLEVSAEGPRWQAPPPGGLLPGGPLGPYSHSMVPGGLLETS